MTRDPSRTTADAATYTMAEAAGHIHKSERWLRDHLKANPIGRFAGRTRLFTAGSRISRQCREGQA